MTFRTEEVLALWPVEPPAQAVTLADLPAAWSLLEAVAWIMLRDPAVVHDTAPETTRPGADSIAEHRLPVGSVAKARQTGTGGNSIPRLDLLVAWTLASDPAANVRSSTIAEDALLAALRTGQIAADAIPRRMTPADWRGLRLGEHAHDGLRPEGMADLAEPWRRVTLDRDAVVALWPARPAAASAVPPDAKPDPFTIARSAMLAFAEETLAKTGRRVRREDAASRASSASGIAYRKMLQLYRELPEHLRNLPPTPGAKRK